MLSHIYISGLVAGIIAFKSIPWREKKMKHVWGTFEVGIRNWSHVFEIRMAMVFCHEEIFSCWNRDTRPSLGLEFD